MLLFYLNTSHVKVNPNFGNIYSGNKINLNTSHVKVNLIKIKYMLLFINYLNTSHVKVNPVWDNAIALEIDI